MGVTSRNTRGVIFDLFLTQYDWSALGRFPGSGLPTALSSALEGRFHNPKASCLSDMEWIRRRMTDSKQDHVGSYCMKIVCQQGKMISVRVSFLGHLLRLVYSQSRLVAWMRMMSLSSGVWKLELRCQHWGLWMQSLLLFTDDCLFCGLAWQRTKKEQAFLYFFLWENNHLLRT